MYSEFLYKHYMYCSSYIYDIKYLWNDRNILINLCWPLIHPITHVRISGHRIQRITAQKASNKVVFSTIKSFRKGFLF